MSSRKASARKPPSKAQGSAPKTAGYSNATLAAKLGIHADERVGLVNAPPHFESLLDPLPSGARLLRAARGRCELWIWFPRNEAELRRDMAARIERLGTRGIWVCWPKKSSGVVSDVDENRIRDVALPAGLVDFKVCAVDATYSGLKLTPRKR